MRPLLGTRLPVEDFETQQQVARYLETARAQDFWLMVYDYYGTKICDAVVQAIVVRFDLDGRILADGERGSSERQIFAVAATLPEDELKLAQAFSAEMPAQMAWKRLPSGTFYRPRTWVSHTNGLPHISPFLIESWARGERPNTMQKWSRFARRGIPVWFHVMGVLGLATWLASC